VGGSGCIGGGCSSSSCCGGGVGGWTYGVVPEGCGDYIACTSYKYVGIGSGNVALFPVPAAGGGCSCWWSICLLWLLLPLCFLLFDSTTTTTTTTTTPFIPITPPPDIPTTTPSIPITPPPDVPTPAPGPPGVCRVFGDPHVITFDGTRASFYSMGEYWLVRSTTVWIQARYAPTPVTNGLSVVKEVAIGGPFLRSSTGEENVLRVSSLAASFNGQPIIPGFPDQFDSEDPAIQVVTDGNGELLQEGRQGKGMHVVHVTLPLGVSVQINRWNEPGEGDYINIKIEMSAQPEQDGHCGNFNGDPNDDTRPLIRSRIGTTGVDPAELLFNVKTPVVAPNRPDLNDCPTDKANRARDLCAANSPTHMADKDCMVDVCFGGDKFADMTDYN